MISSRNGSFIAEVNFLWIAACQIFLALKAKSSARLETAKNATPRFDAFDLLVPCLRGQGVMDRHLLVMQRSRAKNNQMGLPNILLGDREGKNGILSDRWGSLAFPCRMKKM